MKTREEKCFYRFRSYFKIIQIKLQYCQTGRNFAIWEKISKLILINIKLDNFEVKYSKKKMISGINVG
jgi:transcriptional regulator NrdR family protein